MPKLDPRELFLIRDAALKHFIDLPRECRFPGMNRDLTEDEKRTLAYFEASVEAMNRLGLLKANVDQNIPNPIQYTFGHEILDEETEGVLTKTPV